MTVKYLYTYTHVWKHVCNVLIQRKYILMAAVRSVKILSRLNFYVEPSLSTGRYSHQLGAY